METDKWTAFEDGVYEWQQETNPKPDGTFTIAIKRVGQLTKNPKMCFDYNPNSGAFYYNHHSFSYTKHVGIAQIIQIGVKYLKDIGAL